MNFLRRAGSMFKQAPPMANRLFQQAKSIASRVPSQINQLIADGSSLAGKISPVLGQIADGLGQASLYGSKIANHPELKNINSPLLQRGLGNLNEASKLADRGSGLANNLSNFTNESSYNKGSHESNITDALQRGKSVAKEAQTFFK